MAVAAHSAANAPKERAKEVLTKKIVEYGKAKHQKPAFKKAVCKNAVAKKVEAESAANEAGVARARWGFIGTQNGVNSQTR